MDRGWRPPPRWPLAVFRVEPTLFTFCTGDHYNFLKDFKISDFYREAEPSGGCALGPLHNWQLCTHRMTLQTAEVKQLTFLTVVQYGDVTSGDDDASATKLAQEQAVREKLSNVKALLSTGLLLSQLQSEAWHEITRSGFSISPSKAPNALNGDSVNATLYYFLSQHRWPQVELDAMSSDVRSLVDAKTKRAYRAPHVSTLGCYTGHLTLQAPTLWKSYRSGQDLVYSMRLWQLTLRKNGCAA